MVMKDVHIEEIKGVGAPQAYSSVRSLPKSFILAGGTGGSRYSYVGADPFCTVRAASDGVVTVSTVCGPDSAAGDVFRVVADSMERFRYERSRPKPFPFCGGAVGYFAYDLKDFIEPCHTTEGWSGSSGRKYLKNPMAVVGLYDTVFVHDHVEGRSFFVSAGIPDTEARFARFRSAVLAGSPAMKHPVEPAKAGFSSNFTREQYMEAVRKAQEYIAAGDIYQINLSQRLTLPVSGDPLSLFAELLEKSPAPFSSFLDMGGFQIISNSPERLLKMDSGFVETSPIKGTRPRGSTPEEDRRLIEELRNSDKERAEHVMIVDLERNDLGRVCEPGSVKVMEFEKIETYPGLHHMVSTVKGKAAAGNGPLDCLRAVFPGGSITGAPKIRAMEIIDELESTPRGVYTGGIGWVGFDGDMDVAMAIRTAVFEKDTLTLNVGGGIVADSDPGAEYEETLLKAGSFLSALGVRAYG